MARRPERCRASWPCSTTSTSSRSSCSSFGPRNIPAEPAVQLPFAGLHDYALPETIAERLQPIEQIAAEAAGSPIELVVCVTDVRDVDHDEQDAFERVYSSRTTAPEVMAKAVLASAAISALVLPLRIEDVIGTDGGWVRNFPLGHAYDNAEVMEIVGFRYMSQARRPSPENLQRLRRLEPFPAVPPVRALIGEVRAAEETQERGEPPHLADMILRLMRVTVARNTDSGCAPPPRKDASVRELAALRNRSSRSVRHRGALAAARRRRGRAALRGRPLSVPARPGAPADDRPGRPD